MKVWKTVPVRRNSKCKWPEIAMFWLQPKETTKRASMVNRMHEGKVASGVKVWGL